MPENGSPDEARREFFTHAAAHTPMLAVDTPDGFFFVSSDDANIGMSLFVHRRRGEMGVLSNAMGILDKRAQAERARAGPFIDIGANIGTSIICALRSHGFARGVACEPEPRNHRLLELNLAANDFADRARALQVAVSSKPGTTGLVVSKGKSGGHELRSNRSGRSVSAKGNYILKVETLTLDFLVDRSLVSDDGSGMVWIDAQGSEGHILAGGKRLLGGGVPAVLEIAPNLLKRHQGIQPLTAAVKAHYTHYVDLRDVDGDPARPRTLRFRPSPVDKLEEFVSKLDSVRDLLFLRTD